jgi:hypothetical protein
MGVKLVSASAGSVEIVAPATASNYTATMPAGTGTVVVNGINSSIVSGTSQASTSGTSIDFTSIPSWVKRITVMFSGVSLSGTSNILVQLGTSSGVEITGYTSAAGEGPSATSTAGFLGYIALAARTLTGAHTIVLFGSNLWVCTSVANNTAASIAQSGGKTLSGTLDRVRITTVNGTDTFDLGSINILYE